MVAVGAAGTAILVADDLTIVGIADDPLILVTGGVALIGAGLVWLGGE